MVTDPVANMLARIENAGRVQKDSVTIPYSKHVHAVADQLSEAGYIGEVETTGKKAEKQIVLELLYNDDGTLRITGTERVSKPARRLYYGAEDIPQVKHGHGMLVLSTSAGLMSDEAAREAHVGGEALFKIW